MWLQNKKISCHHGNIQFENQLKPVIDLLKTNQIDIIEIDFVCYQNQYISSHDYTLDNITKGSTLEEWVDVIMKFNKILWIDLKDTTFGIFFNSNRLDIPLLFNKLDLLKLKYPNLNQHILIGCQYVSSYQQLLSHDNYTILTDLPQDYAYVLNYLTPFLFKSTLNDYIKTWIQNYTYGDIMALDKSFFNNLDELTTLLDTITASIVILYNFEKGDVIPNIKGKHVIIQYNFKN